MAIEICMASDDNYCTHMGICIVSIMENNESDVNLHILDNNISKENISKLYELKDKYPNLNYFFYNIEEYFSKNEYEEIIYQELKNNSFYKRLGISAYSRLFLTDLIPENVSKILYLDSDTLVLDSLEELFKMNLDDYYCAGVINMNGNVTKVQYTGKLYDTPFINSGVLLINLEKWRDSNFINRSIDLIKNYPNKRYLHDQNIINILSEGQIFLLDPKYNAMSEFYYVKYERNLKLNSYYGPIDRFYSLKQMQNGLKEPTIVHFLSVMWERPWVTKNNLIPHKVRNPFNKKYFEYKEISPWKEEPLQISNLTFNDKLYYEIIRIIMIYLPVKMIVWLRKLL